MKGPLSKKMSKQDQELTVFTGSVGTNGPCTSIEQIIDQLDIMTITGMRSYSRVLKFVEKLKWVDANLGGCYVGIVPLVYDDFMSYMVPELKKENVPLTIEPSIAEPTTHISLFMLTFRSMDEIRQFNETFEVHGLPGGGNT